MSVLACFLAVACSGGVADTLNGPDDTGGAPPSVSSVEVTPSDVSMEVSGTASLTVEVRTADGEPLDRDADWMVRDTSVVAVEGDGDQRQVRGLKEGTTRILAAVDGVADSARVEVTTSSSGSSGPTTVSSVELKPSSVTLAVGATSTLSLSVTSSSGESLNRSGAWKVEDTSVARLSGSGSSRQVEGLKAGSTSVIATVDGVADTATVDVNSNTSSPGAGQPVVVFDPDDYGSTTELRADKTYGRSGAIFLDGTVARPGGSSSMRYDYVNQGAGNAITVGKQIPLPSSAAKEIWVEADVRWSSNYMCCLQLDPNDGDPSTDITSHKLIFGAAKATTTSPNWEISDGRGVYRWGLLLPGPTGNPPNGPVEIETPGVANLSDANQSSGQIVENIGYPIAQLFDEQWHTIRLHWRHSPGRYELWIDGQKVADRSGFDIHPEINTTGLLLGRNKDDGNPSGTESLWWGKVEVWTQDPGW